MSNIVGIIGITVLTSAAAIATKPSAGDLEEYLLDQIETQAANPSYSNRSNPIGVILSLTCQLNPNDCAQALRAMMNIQIEDLAVGQVAIIYMGRKSDPLLLCFGAFNNWWCRDNKPSQSS